MSAHVDYFLIRAAFPDSWAGRHPRLHFRGLLGLHSSYGPPGCSTAQGGLCHEASTQPVTQPNRSSATRPIDNYLGGFFLHWLSVPLRGTPAIWGYTGRAADVVVTAAHDPNPPSTVHCSMRDNVNLCRGQGTILLYRNHHLPRAIIPLVVAGWGSIVRPWRSPPQHEP